jgi:D-amino-acid dehydrogenase
MRNPARVASGWLVATIPRAATAGGRPEAKRNGTGCDSTGYGQIVEPDVIVVGGGAIGVTAAYELARRGLRTTLLERGELGGGCSSGNAGLVCPSHSAPLATPAALAEGVRALARGDSAFSIRPRAETLRWLARFAASCRAGRAERATDAIRSLSLASLALHAELAPLGTEFERRGILSVYETEARLAAGRREAERCGLASRVLSPTEARTVEPGLAGAVAGAVLFPDEAHVDPRRYVSALGEAAAKAGADIQTGVDVRSLGELRAKTVVLAAGAWTAKLLRGLPLTGGKGYHVDFAPSSDDPRIPLLLQEARSAVTPLGDVLRVAGTLEVAGLDLSLANGRVDAMRRAAARVLGHDGREVVDVWAGLRPCTPDGLPVIGRPASLPNVIVATGHAMKGVSLAPVTGRLVAELAAGERPSHDLGPFSPDRF